MSVLYDARRPETTDYLDRPDSVIDDEFVAAANSLSRRGLCNVEIAEMLRCNLRSVFIALNGADYIKRFELEGVKAYNQNERSHTKENEEIIIGIIKSGETDIEIISQTVSIGKQYIVGIARANGYSVDVKCTTISPQKYNRPAISPKRLANMQATKERNERLIHLAATTQMTYSELAEVFQISEKRVKEITHEYNFRRRQR